MAWSMSRRRIIVRCGKIRGMKALFLIGLALLVVGTVFTFGPWQTGAGLLLMLVSLPPLFLGLFMWLLRGAGD